MTTKLDLRANLDLASFDSTSEIEKFQNQTLRPILKLQNDLQENNISFDEIIPVIETKVGLKNLSSILKSDLKKVKRFAFGHCDYNNDCGNFPFFHQDSREYWTWITKIFKELKLYGYTIVNSPCLQLDNEVYFLNMQISNHALPNKRYRTTSQMKERKKEQ